MLIQIPISVGELIDKLSILLIKREKISDKNKLKYVNEEYDSLFSIYNKISFKDRTVLSVYLKEIKQINGELWEIEDKIREKEKSKQFDNEFIALARSVYQS